MGKLRMKARMKSIIPDVPDSSCHRIAFIQDPMVDDAANADGVAAEGRKYLPQTTARPPGVIRGPFALGLPGLPNARGP